MLISAFLGMYYGGLELDSRDHMKSGWKTIFFAYSIYPIIEIAIEERFFMQYISFSTMFELLVFRCMYIIIMRCRFTLGVSVKQEKSKIG